MERPDTVAGERLPRPRRSVLYVPASNRRALAKVTSLPCDAIIVDLEDAVGPDEKQPGRDALADWFGDARPAGRECVVRINALTFEWGPADLDAACDCQPDAILLPKVETADDIRRVEADLNERSMPTALRLWAMIETPLAIANAVAIAATAGQPGSRLDCLVAGTNDLAKDTGVALLPGRPHLSVWLMQMVLAARAVGIDAIDGVYNDFRDRQGFERECADGKAMGFDGKTLIHPGQIETANRIFGFSEDEVATARAIVAAFARPENAGRGVIQMDGRMVERLHLHQAEALLAKATLQNHD